MKAETAAWVAKAEGDYRTAQRERQAATAPNYDAACFHAQQCSEKYLKARLIEADQPFPRIHDLEALLNLVLPLEPTWEALREALQRLTDMAVEVRYPGVEADAEDAEEATRTAAIVRTAARVALGLEELALVKLQREPRQDRFSATCEVGMSKTLKTWGGRSKFAYEGSVRMGTRLHYGSDQSTYVSAEQYQRLLCDFAGATVETGQSRCAAPEGSLGKWLQQNVVNRSIVTYVAPILVEEGYAERVTSQPSLIRIR